jgi:hypothetical protein
VRIFAFFLDVRELITEAVTLNDAGQVPHQPFFVNPIS